MKQEDPILRVTKIDLVINEGKPLKEGNRKMNGELIKLKKGNKPKAKSRWVPSFNGKPPRKPPFVKKYAMQGGDRDDGRERVMARAETEWLNLHGENYSAAKLDTQKAKEELDPIKAEVKALQDLIAKEEKFIMQEVTEPTN